MLPPDDRFPASFYRTAAVCSWLSVITTAMLIFLPEWYTPADSFQGRMARVQDPIYVLRSWVYLLHPFLVMIAALGVALRLRRVAAAWVLPGMLAFLLWGGTEVAQQALTLATFDVWRAAYLAGDPAVRGTMELRTALYDDLWDAMYVPAADRLSDREYPVRGGDPENSGVYARPERLYMLGALLTLTFLMPEFGGPALPDGLGFWLYPSIQPLGRALIGLWLWSSVRPALNDGP